jgi:hypothetical protein
VRHGINQAPREYARDVARQAVGLFAHAFNGCNNPETLCRYAPDAIAELKEALARIMLSSRRARSSSSRTSWRGTTRASSGS